MDRDQFDRLSRLVAAAGTRRDALRLLAAGAIAGAAGGASIAGARDKHRRARGRKQDRVRGEAALQCTNLCFNCAGKRIGPGTNLSRCDFDGRNLAGINLASSNLTNACFARANLTNASFRSANVSGVCFCGADLSGADFRGSRVTAEQLACATVGCTTILPNGKPAVICGPGETCCNGSCANRQTDPRNCGACGIDCGPCKTCANGHCVAVPNDTVACDGSALEPDGGGNRCTTVPGTGVCVDGACSCGFADYDRTTNACFCDESNIESCARNPPPEQCCLIGQICTNGSTLSLCVPCN